VWLAGRIAIMAGAGTAAVAAAWLAQGRPPGPNAPRRRTEPGADANAVQSFHSRPDLRPPSVTIDVPPGPAAAPGLVVTDCHYGPGQQGPLLLDGRGRLVWFLPLSADATPHLRAFNVQVQSYRGSPVLTWFQGAVVNGHGEGHYRLVDAAYREVATVTARHGYHGDLHEFVLTDRGTALFTCYGEARADLTRWGGARDGAYAYGVVQEVDVATGRLLFEWRSDRHVPLEASYEPVVPRGAPWDYFHVNSVAVDPLDGQLILSGRNTWAVYKIDRATGAVLWQLGGKGATVALDRRGRFAFQHHVRRWPDGTLTIFDNEAGPPALASQSRALVLTLDERARRATFAAAYVHHPPVLTPDQGSVQVLADGHRFVGWGISSAFTEYAPDGTVVLDGHLARATQSYRAFRQSWRGLPSRPPDIAARRAGAATVVYASWNGATDVAHWRVVGGAGATSMRTLQVAPHTGFETAIGLAPGAVPAYLVAIAHDAAGRELGRSAPVPAPA